MLVQHGIDHDDGSVEIISPAKQGPHRILVLRYPPWTFIMTPSVFFSGV